jgi:hypothetical protein
MVTGTHKHSTGITTAQMWSTMKISYLVNS